MRHLSVKLQDTIFHLDRKGVVRIFPTMIKKVFFGFPRRYRIRFWEFIWSKLKSKKKTLRTCHMTSADTHQTHLANLAGHVIGCILGNMTASPNPVTHLARYQVLGLRTACACVSAVRTLPRRLWLLISHVTCVKPKQVFLCEPI